MSRWVHSLRSNWRAAHIGVLIVGVCTLGAAQRGVSVTGVVEDQSRALVPGATVRLLEPATKQSREAVTDGEGRFVFEAVSPGTYTLRAELDGFEPGRTTIQVGVAPPAAVRLRLLPQAVETEVTVTASELGNPVAPDRNTDTVEFDSDQLREFPSESVLAVIESFVDPATSGRSGVSVVVDGSEGGTLALPASAIRRLTLNKNPYSAEFQRAGKARAEIVTEHGSRNYFHGRAAYFVRNGRLDARPAYAPTRPDLDRRLFEGSLSGPLPGRGMSFFFGAERLTSDDSALVRAQTLDGPLVATASTSEDTTDVLGRFDLRRGRGGAHDLSVRYALHDTTETNRGVGGLRLPEQAFDSVERAHRVRVSAHDVLSSRLVNDFHVDIGRQREQAGAPPEGSAVVVLGAFSGGASQVFEDARETAFQVQDVVVLSRGARTLRLGGKIRTQRTTATEASDFGGTFEFANLERFAAGAPSLFRISRGNPVAAFTTHDVSGFIQDTWRPRALSVTLGVRYDWESWVHDHNNLSPRLALAFAPGSRRTVLRAGAGVFNESLPDAAIVRTLVFDGSAAEQIVIERPSFPDPFRGGRAVPMTPRIVRLDPALSSPYVVQANVALERELRRNTFFTTDYTILRGTHMLRARNVNAPLPGSSARPDSRVGDIIQLESSGILRSHALAVTFRGRVEEFKGTVQYTLAKATDAATDLFALPVNNWDLGEEISPADFDRRHRFNMAGTYAWPDDRWRIGLRATISSGAPFEITTGFDDNRDGVANDRPAGVSRNAGRGPALAQVDLRVSKLFLLPKIFPERESDQLSDNFELNLDIFNVFNRVNRTSIVGVLGSSLFGQAVAARQPRTIQLSARYRF